jgi:hypothetical protein
MSHDEQEESVSNEATGVLIAYKTGNIIEFEAANEQTEWYEIIQINPDNTASVKWWLDNGKDFEGQPFLYNVSLKDAKLIAESK